MRDKSSNLRPKAQLALALDHHQRGELRVAIDLYRTVLRLDPDNSDALHYLGVAQLQQGHYRRASDLISRAIELNPRNAHCHNNLGEVWRQQDNIEAAMPCFQRALSLAPNYAQANHNLGLCYAALGKLDQAVEWFTTALAHEPGSIESHLALANIYSMRREFAKAASAFESALALNPAVASTEEAFGRVLHELGESERARAAFDRALELEPERASVHCSRGESFLVEGDMYSAVAHFKRCIECDPVHGLAWEKLAGAAKFIPLGSQVLEALETRANDSSLSDEQRKPLYFAFGTILDSQARHEQAFEYFRRANNIARSRLQYDQSTHEARVNHIIDVFNGERITAGLAGANTSDTPVFVVGMARSGTSLLEQIIASHPQAHGAGELEFFSHLKFNRATSESTDYIHLMEEVTPQFVTSFTRGYLTRLREKDETGAKRIVDKMPDNYLHLGLIAMASPNATILHSCRNALDVCLSIYFTNFSFGNRYACNLNDLGHYYFHYARLMKHWHQVLPGRIYDVSYESIVSDQTAQTQRLLDVLNLPWNDACLRFFETQRQVRTASQWQVRQPIYANSVGRAKHYRKYVGELKKAIAGAN